MREEGRISTWQFAMLLGAFLIGSSTVLLPTLRAGRNAWLAVVLAFLAALGVIWPWYALARRLDVPTIPAIMTTLGRYLGLPLALLYLWYYLHLGALVVRNISEIYVTAVMPETPIIVFSGIIMVLAASAVRGGLEVLGRLAELFFPLLFLAILTAHALVAATPGLVHWEYLRPVLGEGLSPVLQSALAVLTFPFGETVLFANVLPFTLAKDKGWRVLCLMTVLTGLVIATTAALHSAVLGADAARVLFPGLALLREISLAEFISRMELLGIFVWTFGTFLKICVCYWAVCLGLAELLGLSDFRPLVFPLGITMVSLSIIVYETFAAMIFTAQFLYPLYALPFQVLIPLILLFVAWLRGKKAQGDGGQSAREVRP